MEKKCRIGFLDSGVGGLSVLACAKRFIPEAEYIYYADTDNVPYGTKTHGEIISYVEKAMRCLTDLGVSAIVIACNTATSIAAQTMREKYDLPIIGMEPALKPAAMRHPNGKILVCATKVTIEGEGLRSLIATTGSDPDLAAMPELVTFAERGIFDKETINVYLRNKIEKSEQYSAVVLGCTHFTYFREAFAEAFPRAEIIDGNIGAVKRLASVTGLELTEKNCKSDSKTVYLRSGREINDEQEIESFRLYENRMSDCYSNL